MGQEYLIDTNAIIDYLDNKLPERSNKLIDNISSKIAVISRIELLSWPNATKNQILVLESFIKGSLVYPLDELTILKTIEIRKVFKIKLPDAVIAATALVNGLSLISRNIKDFVNIPDLNVINPYLI